ncbi:MAG: S8 family serine peptidase [Deinococcaceae bacterium]
MIASVLIDAQEFSMPKKFQLLISSVLLGTSLSACQSTISPSKAPSPLFSAQRTYFYNYPIPGTSPTQYYSPSVYCANDPELPKQTYLYGTFNMGSSASGCATSDIIANALTHNPENGGVFAAWNALSAAAGSLDRVPKIRVAVIDTGFVPKRLGAAAIPPDLAGVIRYDLAKDTTGDPTGPWNERADPGEDWTLTARCPDEFVSKYGFGTPEDGATGHSDAVSAVLAAKINDGTGIAGVAPNIEIIPIRALGTCTSMTKYANFPQDVLDKTTDPLKALFVARKDRALKSIDGVANAIRYAVDSRADVINMSLHIVVSRWIAPSDPKKYLDLSAWQRDSIYPSGIPISDACVNSAYDPQFSALKTLKSAFDYAYDNNVPVIVAAGNDRTTPAFEGEGLSSCGSAITILAVDNKGLTRSDSRRSPKFAPPSSGGRSSMIAAVNLDGAQTYSWRVSDGYAPPTYNLTTAYGTSFAAPIATGMVAMIKQAAKLRGVTMTTYNIHKLMSYGYMPVAEEAYEGQPSYVKETICAMAISRKPVSGYRFIVPTKTVFPEAHTTGGYCGYGPLHAGSMVQMALNPAVDLNNVPTRILFPWEGL